MRQGIVHRCIEETSTGCRQAVRCKIAFIFSLHHSLYFHCTTLYIFTAPPLPHCTATAAANFFTLDRLALQPLPPGAEKREGRRNYCSSSLCFSEKAEDENTDRHLCKETDFRSFQGIHYLFIGPNTEKCKSKQAEKELLHFTFFRIQARFKVAKSRACTLAL